MVWTSFVFFLLALSAISKSMYVCTIDPNFETWLKSFMYLI